MNTFQTRLSSLFPRWLKGGRGMLDYGTPPPSGKQSPQPAAQAAAKQEWENEGGSIKPPNS